MPDTKEVVKLDPLTLEPSDTGVWFLKITRESGAGALEAISDRTETTRISNQKVVDVAYTFDFDTLEYMESSRTERDDPLPESDSDKIARLESENASMQARQTASENAILALMDIL